MKIDPLKRYLHALEEKVRPLIGSCHVLRANSSKADFYIYLTTQESAEILCALLNDTFQTAALCGNYLNITLTLNGLYTLLHQGAKEVHFQIDDAALLPHDHPLFLAKGYAAMILSRKEGAMVNGPYEPELILDLLSLPQASPEKRPEKIKACYDKMKPYWYLPPDAKGLWYPAGRLLAQALCTLLFNTVIDCPKSAKFKEKCKPDGGDVSGIR